MSFTTKYWRHHHLLEIEMDTLLESINFLNYLNEYSEGYPESILEEGKEIWRDGGWTDVDSLEKLAAQNHCYYKGIIEGEAHLVEEAPKLLTYSIPEKEVTNAK